MSSTTTPTYRLELNVPGSLISAMAWEVRGRYGSAGYGVPTAANLAAYIERFVASTREGGVNAHLGETVPDFARIVRQADGRVFAVYEGS